jgi:hypothetical protein
MGAWGTGIFEDDCGCDVLSDILDAEDLIGELSERLSRALETDTIEYDEAFDALVPAAVIDAYVSGTSYTGLGELPPRPAKIGELRGRAAEAVTRVLAPGVEIHELWRGNPTDYPRWKANLEGLVKRLRAHANN